VLAQQHRRAADADHRHQVEQQADPGAAERRDGAVPQHHPGHRAAQGEEAELTPGRRGQLSQPRRRDRSGERQVGDGACHGRGRGGGKRPVGVAQRPEHDRVAAERERAGQDQPGARQRPEPGRAGHRGRAGQDGHASQGDRAAQPGPGGQPLGQERAADQHDPDRLAGQQQPGRGRRQPPQASGDRQRVTDHAQDSGSRQPGRLPPAQAPQRRHGPRQQHQGRDEHAQHEQGQRSQLAHGRAGRHRGQAPQHHGRETAGQHAGAWPGGMPAPAPGLPAARSHALSMM
jgi:hypothetical protein